MGELTSGGEEEDTNLVGGGSTGGIFPGGTNEQIFSWWEEPPPILPSRQTKYIYTIVPACVLISLANHNPAIFSVPWGTEKLNKLPQADKKPR